MSSAYFVEVLHRNKEVRHRHRVESLPIKIGRAYDNDIILDDPHASAHHAVIDLAPDGGMLVKDLVSQNGIIHNGKRQTDIVLDGNTIFRLGHTSLRVRSSEFPVEITIADTSFYDWEGWRPALAGLLLIVCLGFISIWIDDTEQFEVVRYVKSIAAVLVVTMLWCGIWAFANRLFGGHARLGRHLFTFGCGLVAWETWGFASTAAAYSLSLEVFTRYGSHVAVAIFAVMIYFHLLNIKPHRTRLIAAACAILAVIGSGLILMTNYHQSNRLASELFMSERFPPAVRLSANKPVIQLISSAAELKAKVDAERTKSLTGDETDNDDQD